jgi:peptide chain release factor subunit 1
MVTEAEVRDLAAHRGDPVVTSLYLDVDGGHRPAPADYDLAFHRLADDVVRRARASDDDALSRAVEADVDTMRGWLNRGLDRTTTRGVALFASSGTGFFQPIELPRPVRDDSGMGPAPHVGQLLATLDEHQRFLVALVDKRQLRLIRVELGEPTELPGIMEPDRRYVDKANEVERFEHTHLELDRAHYRRAADAVARALADWRTDRLVVGGPEEAVAGMQSYLSPAASQKVVGRVGASLTARARDIADAANAVAEAAERRRQTECVEELRQHAAAERQGVVGLEPTLAALADKRVASLLVSEGFTAPGARCPSCGWLGPAVHVCPTCGTTTAEIEDVVELAIAEALGQSATVEFCRGTELDGFGRIGAVTRY